MQNNIEDVYSLIKFLRHEPWDERRWWAKIISEPHERHTKLLEGASAGAATPGPDPGLAMLKKVLCEILLRRTKEMLDSVTGLRIVELPPRSTEIVNVVISPDEREFYDALVARSRAVFSRLEGPQGGQARKSRTNQYAALLTLLLRMRQACCHPFLVIRTFGGGGGEEEGVSSEGIDAEPITDPNHDPECDPPGVEEKDQDQGEGDIFAGMFGRDFLQALYARLQKSRYTAAVLRRIGGSDVASPGSSGNGGGPVECPICFEETVPSGLSITSCGHLFCTPCATNLFGKHAHASNEGRNGANGKAPKLAAMFKTKSAPAPVPAVAPLIAPAAIGAAHAPIAAAAIAGTASCPVCGAQCSPEAVFMMSNMNDVGNDEAPVLPVPSAAVTIPNPNLPVPSAAVTIISNANGGEGSSGSGKQNNWMRWGDARFKTGSSRSGCSGSGSNGAMIVDADQGGFFSSAKLDAIMHKLLEVLGPGLNPDSTPPATLPGSPVCVSHSSSHGKVCIFSQWTSYLDLVERRLCEGPGVKFLRLDGSLSQQARSKVLSAFASDPSVRVLLLSLKAGGVGLNLTMASTVFLCDPWWNPFAELQAVDRVHRIGQTREVRVFRFVCKDTVEERLLDMQQRKLHMSAQALSDSASKESAGRLTIEELKSFFL